MNKAVLLAVFLSIIFVSSVDSFVPSSSSVENKDRFIVHASPNQDAEVDASNVVAEKRFDSGDAYPRQLIFAHDYLWATTFTSPARLLKIDPDTLEHQRIIFDSAYPNATDMVATENAIWIIFGTDPTKIIKVNPSTLAWSEVVSFPSNELVFGGSLEYAYGYIWAGGYHNALARINPINFSTEVFQYSLTDNGTHFVNIVQGLDEYLWAATASAAGQGGLSEILKIDSADPTSYQTVQLTQKVSDDIAYAEGALFAVGEQNPSEIFKINDDLTYTTTQTIGPSYGVSWSSIDQRLYATYATSPGLIKSFDTDLNELKSITLPTGYNSPNEIATDGERYLYATTWQNPFRLVKVDLTVWTLLYYLAEDNNLNDSFSVRESSLEAASANPKVHITYFLDPAENHWWNPFPDPQSYYYSFTDANRKNLGETNSGDPQTLIDFVRWSQENYWFYCFLLLT